MKIALAQINPIVGDVAYNLTTAVNAIEAGYRGGADVILLPELVTTGYPPRDLLFRSDLIDANLEAKKKLIELTRDIPVTIVFGYAERRESDGMKPLRNAVCVAQNGEVLQTRFKTLLPTYDVFEEYRYFEPGEKVYQPVQINGVKVGVINCEESWNEKEFWADHIYDVDPVEEMVKAGAEYIFVINASPYRKGTPEIRRKMIARHCKKHNVGIAYVNQWGYNDEVGFDGNSFVCNRQGEVISHARAFANEVMIVDTEYNIPLPKETYQQPWQEEVLTALKCGIQDYYGKLNMKGPAIIGLSGGIDSAIVAYLAVQALGKDRVVGIGMPSEFSSEGSVSDAEKIAKKLGIHFTVQSIKVAHTDLRRGLNCINHYLTGGKPDGSGPPEPELFGRKIVLTEDSGVTDENIQARIRGVYLMGLANYYNGLVLSTGNKSEMAVGYCTLYGDMCGGLAVISDVPKTMVFDLCRYINEQTRDEIIPWNTINKPPSAELRKDQKDSDSLPPYPTLDAILFKLVDQGKAPEVILREIATVEACVRYAQETNRNLEKDIVWVCTAVTRNEFKRKQAPTGLKISNKHFKYGWTQPIVHRLPTMPVKGSYGN